MIADLVVILRLLSDFIKAWKMGRTKLKNIAKDNRKLSNKETNHEIFKDEHLNKASDLFVDMWMRNHPKRKTDFKEADSSEGPESK